MTQKLVSKKELKSVYGVPYSFQHIARLEAAGQFPNADQAWRLQGQRQSLRLYQPSQFVIPEAKRTRGYPECP